MVLVNKPEQTQARENGNVLTLRMRMIALWVDALHVRI
jgi:hypothetical protein